MENYSTWTIIAFTDIDFETVRKRGSDKINYTHTHPPTHTYIHIYISFLLNVLIYYAFIIYLKKKLSFSGSKGVYTCKGIGVEE